MPVYFSTLTDIGLTKLATADGGGAAVNITTMKLGDGNGVYVTPLPSWLDLTNVVWTGAINFVYPSLNDATIFVMEGAVPVADGGFWVREMGFFDAAGDMIAVANVPDTYKPTLAEGAKVDQYYRSYFKHNNASSVTVSVDPSVVLASNEFVQTEIALYIDQTVKTTSSPTFVALTVPLINGGTPWTTANDGAGSALDADLLDGYDSSTTPAQNKIPIATESDGRLGWGWKPKHRGALVNLSVNISVPSGYILVPFDNEVNDTDGIHTTGSTRLVVPAGITKVSLKGSVAVQANVTGYRLLTLLKNGAELFDVPCKDSAVPSSAASTYLQINSPEIDVVAGDYFELIFSHNAGVNLLVWNTATWFSMKLID